jgi:hypothetical protein
VTRKISRISRTARIGRKTVGFRVGRQGNPFSMKDLLPLLIKIFIPEAVPARTKSYLRNMPPP